jgi:hypothetical protein
VIRGLLSDAVKFLLKPSERNDKRTESSFLLHTVATFGSNAFCSKSFLLKWLFVQMDYCSNGFLFEWLFIRMAFVRMCKRLCTLWFSQSKFEKIKFRKFLKSFKKLTSRNLNSISLNPINFCSNNFLKDYCSKQLLFTRLFFELLKINIVWPDSM